MQTLWQDLRYGARMLLKNTVFTSIATLTLAIGVGANTAIFSIVDKLLVRSLAVKEPGRLVLINKVSVKPHFVSTVFSYPDFHDYREQNQVFSDLLVFRGTRLEFKTGDRIERVSAEYVSGNYFDALGVAAAQGRTFSPEEDRTPGAQPVAVVSDGFWRQRFGADPNLIGRTITLNNVPLTVIGVATPSFNGMRLEEPTEVWVPVLAHPQLAQSSFIKNRKDGFLFLMGRVKEGVSHAQAEASFDALAQQVKEANTPPGVITKGMPFSEQHIKFEPGGRGVSVLRERFSSPLKLLMAVVGLVLLIACANVAGLSLARGVARRKEMAIRLALGAGRLRVARQLLTESLLLAFVGGAAGLLIAPWLVTLLVKTQSRLSVAQTLLGETVDLRALAFTALSTLLAGIVFGLAPAWQSARADLVHALKEEGGVSDRRERRFGFRNLLVVAQLALAIVVLAGAGLLIKSLRNLLALDPGYQTERMLIAPLDLNAKKYDEARGGALQREFLERLSALPGVEVASYGLVMPLSGSLFTQSLFVEGRQPLPSEQMAFDANIVGPRYHETMGIVIVAGRGFTEQDRVGAPGVVIINETMARRFFPGENPLGKILRVETNGPPLEIIGVARDIKHHDLTETPVPHFDLPALQRGYDGYTNFVARVKGRAADSIPSARGEMLALDPALRVDGVTTMSEQIGKAVSALRLASTLIGIFGLVALLLAAIGLYGVTAWMVSRRTREIGVRMALGARGGDVLKLIFKQGAQLVGIGVAMGLGVALIAMRLVESQLYGVSRNDPATYVFVVSLLAGAALLACYVPARRATKVDPMVALRVE